MNNLPPAFEIRMKKQLSKEADAFFKALENPAPVSIRLNPDKTRGEIPDSLTGLIQKTVEWCPEGYYLSRRPVFTLDPYYQGGAYYVQEASSMFLGQIFKQLFTSGPLKILDLCAAPGGKSTLAVSLLPTNSLLVANEVIHSRAAILKENLIRWGNGNVIVTNNDPADFSAFEGSFDVVIADAPCSGEGMFRKDPASVSAWNEANLHLCSERQKRILTDIWPALKPGGYLIYSTCTYNPEENEGILDWLCSSFQAESIAVRHTYPTVTTADAGSYGYHFYPHKTSGEGFFCGLIRKKDGAEYRPGKNKKQKSIVSCRIPEELSGLLSDTSLLSARNDNNLLTVFPSIHADFIYSLRQELKVISFGCEVAELYKRKPKLLHSLALSNWLNKEACRSAEVDLPTALRFLKKEDIQVEARAGEWILITYRGIALGWGKSLGNRLNNYLPKEWRIRMDIPADFF